MYVKSPCPKSQRNNFAFDSIGLKLFSQICQDCNYFHQTRNKGRREILDNCGIMKYCYQQTNLGKFCLSKKKAVQHYDKHDFFLIFPCQYPDYELCQRISGQRQNPVSGEIYQRSQWDPNVIGKHKKEKDKDKEGEEGEEEEEEEQDKEEEEEEEEVNVANLQQVQNITMHFRQSRKKSDLLKYHHTML